jgi:hypothetical protein
MNLDLLKRVEAQLLRRQSKLSTSRHTGGEDLDSKANSRATPWRVGPQNTNRPCSVRGGSKSDGMIRRRSTRRSSVQARVDPEPRLVTFMNVWCDRADLLPSTRSGWRKWRRGR